MKRPAVEIRIGLGSCGVASGGEPVRAALEQAVAARATVKTVGCNGMCYCEPMVEVLEPGGRSTLYGNVTADGARNIVRKHLRPRWHKLLTSERSLTVAAQIDETATPVRAATGVPPWGRERSAAVGYLGKQKRIVLENCGEIDPLNIDDYLARSGYQALSKCRELPPEEAIDTIAKSGLRGRGGAGFPTGTKWKLARANADPVKYVICNGDEGDPGAFMDRLVLESDPHRVLEGLAIAAYAVGATQGYLYIRAEYPLAVRHTRAAIVQAAERGLLGGLRLEVREGAGAFVCGEETALIQSLEGKRGMPKLRPPYPVDRGFRGKPTVINNVETLACVPWILRHGAEAFAAFGTATSRGTKVFALAGKINRGGLIEVPMGITIREVVEEIGGGIKHGREFKAVQLGGPSGGCIPARLADTPIDYDALAQTGAIMGSGGMVVLDERDCMVDMARFFLKFTQSESCGKCTFCRIGTKRMLEILERLCAGQGRRDDLEKLTTLADYVSRGSLCGLGQTAPNPVLTTLRYFREEYEAHLEGRCPAGRCPALIRYRVNGNCIGCTLCAQACPVGAIAYRPYEKHEVDERLCTRCDMCRQACQDDAVEVVSP
jgi:NADH-quinone oxidoreductase subunit F